MALDFGSRYEKLRLIDHGGMASVYLARDHETGHDVAVKVLDEKLGRDQVYKKRFISEVKLTMKIDSPFVVKVLDFHWDESIQYFVMEYLSGEQLRELVRKEKKLSEKRAVYYGAQVALGLASMHKLGIIHRDIKPQNIMILADHKVKIIDLGIAKSHDSEQLTQTGIIIASIQYVAPEILRGEKATVQSDIYALGIMLFFLTQGTVPFRSSDDEEVMVMHKRSALPLMKSVSRPLQAIITKATAKKPTERYASALEMFNALKSLLD